jgi:ubiquinone/menaquinone biosynthesis C-methylase UbiE
MADGPSLVLDDEGLARDYDRLSATRQFESGKRLAADLGIAAGERVLDVGCGTGLLAEHIADLVGPSGRVLGVDPLPSRIGIATARARANLAFQVGDARDLGFLPDSSVDVVVLNAVFHWLPEKMGPLREFARVLRPGGRIGIGTRAKGHRTLVHEVVLQVMSAPAFVHHPLPRDRIVIFVDEQEMRMLLEEAGFTPTLIELRQTEQAFPSPELAIRYAEASSFGNFLGHLPDDLRAEAREEVRRRLAVIAASTGLVQRGQRLIAIATRN